MWRTPRSLEAAAGPEPRADATARWLTYLDGEGKKVLRLTPGDWVIGREPGSAVLLQDFAVSKRHAKLVVAVEGVRVIDLKSKCGTQVNETPVMEATVTSGDVITVGKFQLRFVEGPEPR
jgi:pSer/pThr/pTyr-binding forkhead associated (FHA) protein